MRAIVVLVSALAITQAGGAYASEISPPDYTAMSDADLSRAVAELGEDFYPKACDRTVPLLEEQYRRLRVPLLEPGLFLARAFCAEAQGRFRDASDHLAQFSERRGPLAVPLYRLYIAARAEDAEAALSTWRVLAEKGDAKTIGSLQPDVYFAAARVVRRQLGTGELEEIALAQFTEGRFGLYQVDLQPSLAVAALAAAARKDRLDIVPELLSFIRRPDSYDDLLADRRFESVWPQIEDYVGPNLVKVSEAYRRWALARLEADGDDRDRFSAAAYALHLDGRFEEAIALARSWRERDGAFDEIEEGDGWALNIEAYALDALGREAEADAVFDRLAQVDPDLHPWVVSFVINRASRLVGQKRLAEGLAATTLARSVAEKSGTTFSKMLIARDRTCALYGLGRGNEAAEELDFLLTNRNESVSSAATGLLCAGRRQEAADIVLAGLADDKLRPGVLPGLLPQRFELFYTRTELPLVVDLLESDPRLKSEYQRWARPIPEEFVPRATLLREAIAAP
jgi:tetratricopeptide (TPR) repeat protein